MEDDVEKLKRDLGIKPIEEQSREELLETMESMRAIMSWTEMAYENAKSKEPRRYDDPFDRLATFAVLCAILLCGIMGFLLGVIISWGIKIF